MNYIDIIIAMLLAFAAILGIWKGFIRQLVGLIALFGGLFCAYHFSDFAASYISGWIEKNETAVIVISFSITFLLVLLGVMLIGRLTEQFIKIATLGVLNRLIGLLFSLAKMAFIMSVCIWLLQAFDQLWPFFPHQDAEKSLLYAPVARLAPTLFPYLKNFIAGI